MTSLTEKEQALLDLYISLELKIIKNYIFYYKHPKDGNIYKLCVTNSFKRTNRGATFKVISLEHDGYISKSLIKINSFIKLNSLQCINLETNFDKLLISVFYNIVKIGATTIDFSKKQIIINELSTLLVKHPDEYYNRLTEIELSPYFDQVRKTTTNLF